MINESPKRFCSKISYLKYKLGVAESLIIACKSGKYVDPTKLKNAIAIRNILQSMLKKAIADINTEILSETRRDEEEVLRQNKIR